MATPPDFSSGAVLTAAQMSSVGCWLVKTQTVGTAVANVLVTSAFTSDYENYRITYTGGVQSATSYLSMQFGIGATMTATGYSGGTGWMNVGAASWNITVDNSAGSANYVGGGGTAYSQLDLTVNQPQLAKQTFIFGQQQLRDFGRFGFCSYVQDSNTQFTSFRITPLSGTMTGGTIRVYGMRN